MKKYTFLILLVSLISLHADCKPISTSAEYEKYTPSEQTAHILKQDELTSDPNVLRSAESDHHEITRLQQINTSLRVVVILEILISLIIFMRFALEYLKSRRPVFSAQENAPFKFS